MIDMILKPKLRTLSNVKDEINQNIYSQRISKETILNGSYSFTLQANLTNVYRYIVINWEHNTVAKPDTDIYGISADGNYIYAGGDERCLRVDSTPQLRVSIEKTKIDAMAGADTLSKFKTYLDTYPITINYQLKIQKIFMSEFMY